MKRAAYILFIFIAAQVLSSVLVSFFLNLPRLIAGEPLDATLIAQNPTALGICLLLADVCTLFFAWLVTGHPRLQKEVSKPQVGWSILVTLPAILIVNLLTVWLALPDTNGPEFTQMVSSPLCLFVMVLLGPVVEEFVFRYGILGSLIKGGASPIVAIVVSAVLFGLVHFNPAQTPAAVCLGALFGWIYVRTGSLWPCIAIHVLNNLVGVVQLLFMPDATDSVSLLPMWIQVSLLVVAVILFIIFIKCFLRLTSRIAQDA